MSDAHDQLLFSYAALQSAELQRATFGRIAEVESDILVGYTADYVEIEESRFSDVARHTTHPVLRHTGNPRDKVMGKVLLLSESELDAADQLEMAMFRRAPVVLASGRPAWVYVMD